MGFQLIAPLTAAGFSIGGSKLISQYMPRNAADLPSIQRLAAIGAVAVGAELVQYAVERVMTDAMRPANVVNDFDDSVIDGEVIDHED